MRGIFQTLERAAAAALLAVAIAGPALAAEPRPLVGRAEAAHLKLALQQLDMTRTDLGFEKDVGKPLLALARTRRLLAEPLELPALAGEVLQAASGQDDREVWALASSLLELPPAQRARPRASGPPATPWDTLTPKLARAVTRFVTAAQAADALLDDAFRQVAPADMRYALASFFAGTFNAEDRPAVRRDLLALGLSADDVERAVREGMAMDPEPAATNLLAVIRRTDLSALLAAGRVFQQACAALAGEVAGVRNWPGARERFQTPMGEIVIGTTGSDAYANAALLIVDPGGDDRYHGGAGAANGLAGQRLSAIVDLSGSDRYTGGGVLGPGAAAFGVSVLMDQAGDDVYEARYAGQAGAVFGAAWLEDAGGDDVYRAHAQAQAAGYVGMGCLWDRAGNDLYDVGFLGQGCAGVMGVGLLTDVEGNDRYLAGGREHDHERNDERYVSLAQGFAIGLRPFAGGGFGALVDLAGNDSYVADVFGQGVGYWYSVGLLLDLAGNDAYVVHQYGQGTGIHLSSGLLADYAGNDTYTAFSLAQGSAHDYAVGMLFEGEGNDTYTSGEHSQGRGMNNGLALLLDTAGDDGYFARQPGQCQGIGNDGDKREYGSLALLMDLGGKDIYSCGAADGARLLRPDFGIVYDVKPE